MPDVLSHRPQSVVRLRDTEAFARGGRRACYVHPDHADRCIKVALPGKQPADLRKKDPWWKRLRGDDYYDENIKDQQFLSALFGRLGPSAENHLPQVFGILPTDLGPGLVTELVRDADGAISLSCKEYVRRHGYDEVCAQALQELKRFLFEGLVPLRDAFPHNIALRKNADGSLTAKIIDGLGLTGLFARCQTIPRIARARLERKFARLIVGVERTATNRAKGLAVSENGFQQASRKSSLSGTG